MNTKIEIELIEAYSKKNKTLSATVEVSTGGICIGAKNLGEKTVDKGFGTPIVIENRNGVLWVIIFGDINSSDPTHQISLDGALESKRLKESAILARVNERNYE